ncbi:MAG: hypothetical protein PHI79_06515 [Sulfurovaceae bacterium]|nr:hypothetical protein [Sulfurovaceae bacterium]MDD5549229.1 hypothetical protein [Sulfurovaceae bacterium]
MNRIIKIIFVLLAIGSIATWWLWYQAPKQEKNLAVVYTINGNGEAKFDDLMDNKLADTGFIVTDPHKRINDSYKKHFGSTNLELISFMPTVNLDKVRELLAVEPRLALYSPFNMLAYNKTGENTTKVMHLTPEAILDIAGVEDEGIKTKFISMFKPLDEKIQKVYGGEKSYITYNSLDNNRIMNYEITFERPKDLSEFVDKFQEKFEAEFEDNKYIIAGYYDFKVNLKENAPTPLPEYDAFWIYSLCHLEFSYNIFDKQGMRPDAGIFAPCTMYMYIKKGSNKLIIGMPKLQNWATTLKITDKKRLDYIHKLDTQIPQILQSLGAVETGGNTNSKTSSIDNDSKNKISNNTANNNKFLKPNPKAGEVVNGQVPAYLRSKYMQTNEVISSLKKGGFTHIATQELNANQSVVIFTNSEIISGSVKPHRGFSANLKVLIDKTNNQLTITNPIYQFNAFLQDDYDKAMAQKTLERIRKIFPNSINSDDKLNFKDLANYHFMVSMPYYQDMIEIASGTNATLIAKIKASKNLVYEQKVSSNATIFGIKLSDRTSKFASKIGSQNTIVLPYTILVENNKAYILHPKYYIALMYPLLDMGTFMTIATAPGAIENEIKGVFN